MNKYLIQGFIILVIILLGVSLISEVNDKQQLNQTISDFEENVNGDVEVDNGNLDEVHIISEDNSNLISNVNAKIATFIVEGLNYILKLGIKVIEGVTN